MPSIIKYIGTIKQGLSLVVADNGLVPRSLVLANDKGVSLKPCCSGRWSRTATSILTIGVMSSLNPYCNGRWSRTNVRCSTLV